MENMLFQNIMPLKKRIERDKDAVGLFSGVPGVGKSTLAQQVMYPLDLNISIDSIKYSASDVVKYTIGLFNEGKSRGRGYIHDEAREVVSATKQFSKKTRMFMDFIYENRQMNMYQWLLSGDFFDFPKSIVMERAIFMIYVHEEADFRNGYFKFYNRRDMRELYLKGKDKRDINSAKYSFRGTFPKFYTVDEEKYRALKKKHILDFERYMEDTPEKELSIKEIVIAIKKINPELKYSDIRDAIPLDKSYFYRVIRDMGEVVSGQVDTQGNNYNGGNNEINKFLELV